METSPESTGETLFDPTLFAAATPVSLSASPGYAEEKTTLDTSGPTSETPLATYDPATRSWKTSGGISLWGDCPSLATLPPSGMTRNGALFQRPPWEPTTDETASSLLHTPTAKMNQMAPSMKSGWWPTPQSNDYKNARVRHRTKSLQVMLGGAIATSDPSLIGGHLNPR